jgi:hypothetical protein
MTSSGLPFEGLPEFQENGLDDGGLGKTRGFNYQKKQDDQTVMKALSRYPSPQSL